MDQAFVCLRRYDQYFGYTYDVRFVDDLSSFFYFFSRNCSAFIYDKVCYISYNETLSEHNPHLLLFKHAQRLLATRVVDDCISFYVAFNLHVEVLLTFLLPKNAAARKINDEEVGRIAEALLTHREQLKHNLEQRKTPSKPDYSKCLSLYTQLVARAKVVYGPRQNDEEVEAERMFVVENLLHPRHDSTKLILHLTKFPDAYHKIELLANGKRHHSERNIVEACPYKPTDPFHSTYYIGSAKLSCIDCFIHCCMLGFKVRGTHGVRFPKWGPFAQKGVQWIQWIQAHTNPAEYMLFAGEYKMKNALNRRLSNDDGYDNAEGTFSGAFNGTLEESKNEFNSDWELETIDPKFFDLLFDEGWSPWT